MQQLPGVPSYSTTLFRTKNGNVFEPKPCAASCGMSTVWTSLSHQPISRPPRGPQVKVPSAAAEAGAWPVIGSTVVGTRLTCRSGLSPVGLVWLRNSARRNALANWLVPMVFPPHTYLVFRNTGEASNLLTELPAAHESATVGSKVAPFDITTITGTTTVVMLLTPLARFLNGFLPTIVYGNVVPPSVTVRWNSGIDGVTAAARLERALMFGETPSSYRAFKTVRRPISLWVAVSEACAPTAAKL